MRTEPQPRSGVKGYALLAEQFRTGRRLELRLLRREVSPDFSKNPKGYFYRAAVNVSLQTVRLRERHILTGESEKLPANVELSRRAHALRFEEITGGEPF